MNGLLNVLYLSIILWISSYAIVFAQFGAHDAFGFRLGYATIQNREPNNLTTPLYAELNYHVPLANNEGYEMIYQWGYTEYSFNKRERSQIYRHDDFTTVAQLTFVNNERNGFEFYYGAGGGGGITTRRSKITGGNLKGEREPSSHEGFILFHVTAGFGWYDSGSGLSVEADYANWGGLFLVLASISYIY